MRRSIVAISSAWLVSISSAAAAQDVTTQSTSTLEAGAWSAQLAVGRSGTDPRGDGLSLDSEPSLTGIAVARYGITDRLTLSIPSLAFAYRFGHAGGTELIPFAGLTGWGAGYSSVEGWILAADLGAGAAIRFWTDDDTSINVDGQVRSSAQWTSSPFAMDPDARFGPTTWRTVGAVGLSHRVGRWLSVHAGGSVGATAFEDGEMVSSSQGAAVELRFGSVQSIGLRPLPLLEVHLSDRVSIDGYASIGYEPDDDTTSSRFLVGTTFSW